VIDQLALAVIVAGLTFAGIYSYGRIEHWKAAYEMTSDDLDKALVRISEAERIMQSTVEKHEAVMAVFKSMSDRPVVAALSEKHINQIVNSLSMIAAQNQAPNRLN